MAHQLNNYECLITLHLFWPLLLCQVLPFSLLCSCPVSNRRGSFSAWGTIRFSTDIMTEGSSDLFSQIYFVFVTGSTVICGRDGPQTKLVLDCVALFSSSTSLFSSSSLFSLAIQSQTEGEMFLPWAPWGFLQVSWLKEVPLHASSSSDFNFSISWMACLVLMLSFHVEMSWSKWIVHWLPFSHTSSSCLSEGLVLMHWVSGTGWMEFCPCFFHKT